MGKALFAYIVFDNDDEIKLQRIFDRTIRERRDRPKIYKMKPNPQPIGAHPHFERTKISHPRYPTIFDALVTQN